MGDLRTRIEITKLAHEIGVPEDELGFLAASRPEDVRDLRAAASAAIFARHESRVKLLAALSRRLPVPITAKISQLALGPLLSARIAGAMDPAESAKLAKHLDPDFLAKLSASLDPTRVAPILRQLPDDLLITVGRKVLADGDFPTLGRLVSVVSPEVSLGVVEGAPARDLLQVALFTDDPASLDAVLRHYSDDQLAGMVKTATAEGFYDAAVSLLLSLSPETNARIVAQVGVVSADDRDALVAAIDEHEVWPAVLPALRTLDPTVLADLVNVPATLPTRVIDRAIGVAHELGQAATLAAILLCLDAEHLVALKQSKVLSSRDLQDWVIATGDAPEDEILSVLRSLDLR